MYVYVTILMSVHLIKFRVLPIFIIYYPNIMIAASLHNYFADTTIHVHNLYMYNNIIVHCISLYIYMYALFACVHGCACVSHDNYLYM